MEKRKITLTKLLYRTWETLIFIFLIAPILLPYGCYCIIMRLFGNSPTSSGPKYYFKINLSNNGSKSIFMVADADLKTISDIETEVFKRHPEIPWDELTIHYYDKNLVKIPISDSVEFDLFMETHYDRNIYVSWVNDNVRTIKNVPNDSSWIDDLILWSALIFLGLYIIFSLADHGGFFQQHRDDEILQSENPLDQWAQHKRIVHKFCHGHTAVEECQSTIENFLSFMSFDTVADANK